MDAVKRRTVVKPGGVIEMSVEELPVGTTVEVTLQPVEASRSHLRDLRGSGKGVYSSQEDIDNYIRKLRDEWDS